MLLSIGRRFVFAAKGPLFNITSTKGHCFTLQVTPDLSRLKVTTLHGHLNSLHLAAIWSQDETTAQLVNGTQVTGHRIEYDGAHTLLFNLPTPLVPIHPNDDLNYCEIHPKYRGHSYPNSMTVVKNQIRSEDFTTF